MIIELFIFVMVTVGWCCGFFLLTSDGYILYFIRKPFEKIRNVTGVPTNISTTLAQKGVKETVIPEWIGNPIVKCMPCTASLHGLWIFSILVLSKVIEFNLIVLILGVVIASFLQTFLWKLYEKINK